MRSRFHRNATVLIRLDQTLIEKRFLLLRQNALIRQQQLEQSDEVQELFTEEISFFFCDLFINNNGFCLFCSSIQLEGIDLE